MKPWKAMLSISLAAIIAFFGYGAYVASTPDGQARAHERAVIEQCRKQLAQPDIPENSKRIIIAPTCQRFEDDFRRKWNREP